MASKRGKGQGRGALTGTATGKTKSAKAAAAGKSVHGSARSGRFVSKAGGGATVAEPQERHVEVVERTVRGKSVYIKTFVGPRAPLDAGQSRDRTQVSGPAAPRTAEAVSRLVDAILGALSRKDRSGALLVQLDPDEFAERLVDQLDTAPLWSEHLGPVYSAKSVTEILGVSKQAVQQNAGLLRMTTGDGTVVYPAFQFSGTAVLPGVKPIVQAARGHVDNWTLASWFASPNDDLGGARPIDAIAAGFDRQTAQVAAVWLERVAA